MHKILVFFDAFFLIVLYIAENVVKLQGNIQIVKCIVSTWVMYLKFNFSLHIFFIFCIFSRYFMLKSESKQVKTFTLLDKKNVITFCIYYYFSYIRCNLLSVIFILLYCARSSSFNATYIIMDIKYYWLKCNSHKKIQNLFPFSSA